MQRDNVFLQRPAQFTPMETPMQGSQLTVFAAKTAPRKHHRTTVDWILDEARQAGIQGATVIEVSECVDVQGRYHAARFLELADQPRAITLAGANACVDALLERLRQGGVRLFYTRCAVEYEVVGDAYGDSR
jgi:PII-like signaling protein